MSDAPTGPSDASPLRDRSFLAMLVTQLLGAFNDNLFKQLIVLLAVQQTLDQGLEVDRQAEVMLCFALPMLLFSGFAGALADRFPKTAIILGCKWAEVVVMVAGAGAFLVGQFELLLVVLFLMGAQTALFGPAKYGVLPELLSARRLPAGNGAIQMTTFVSIIAGMACAGLVRDAFERPTDGLLAGSLLSIVIALIGVSSARQIRRLPAAQPALPLSALGGLGGTLLRIWRDKAFFGVVLANGYLWFMGAVVQQLLNYYGLALMGLSKTRTSLLGGSLCVGLALGSVLGGVLSRGRINLRLTQAGFVGITLALAGLAFAHRAEWATHLCLLLLGTSGGTYALPLFTLIQLRPAADEKGRVIAATNVVNWALICGAALVYGGSFLLIAKLTSTKGQFVPAQWIPAGLATLNLLLAWPLLRLLGRLDAEHRAAA